MSIGKYFSGVYDENKFGYIYITSIKTKRGGGRPHGATMFDCHLKILRVGQVRTHFRNLHEVFNVQRP